MNRHRYGTSCHSVREHMVAERGGRKARLPVDERGWTPHRICAEGFSSPTLLTYILIRSHSTRVPANIASKGLADAVAGVSLDDDDAACRGAARSPGARCLRAWARPPDASTRGLQDSPLSEMARFKIREPSSSVAMLGATRQGVCSDDIEWATNAYRSKTDLQGGCSYRRT